MFHEAEKFSSDREMNVFLLIGVCFLLIRCTCSCETQDLFLFPFWFLFFEQIRLLILEGRGKLFTSVR